MHTTHAHACDMHAKKGSSYPDAEVVLENNTISSLNDYQTVALTPVILIVLRNRSDITSCPAFDPFQYAYRANRSTEDTISDLEMVVWSRGVMLGCSLST